MVQASWRVAVGVIAVPLVRTDIGATASIIMGRAKSTAVRLAAPDPATIARASDSAFKPADTMLSINSTADQACQICHRTDGADAMVPCDGCSDEYHTYCMCPKRRQVPRGVWFCPACVDLAVKRRFKLPLVKQLFSQKLCADCKNDVTALASMTCSRCRLLYHEACVPSISSVLNREDFVCHQCAQIELTQAEGTAPDGHGAAVERDTLPVISVLPANGDASNCRLNPQVSSSISLTSSDGAMDNHQSVENIACSNKRRIRPCMNECERARKRLQKEENQFDADTCVVAKTERCVVAPQPSDADAMRIDTALCEPPNHAPIGSVAFDGLHEVAASSEQKTSNSTVIFEPPVQSRTRCIVGGERNLHSGRVRESADDASRVACNRREPLTAPSSVEALHLKEKAKPLSPQVTGCCASFRESECQDSVLEDHRGVDNQLLKCRVSEHSSDPCSQFESTQNNSSFSFSSPLIGDANQSADCSNNQTADDTKEREQSASVALNGISLPLRASSKAFEPKNVSSDMPVLRNGAVGTRNDRAPGDEKERPGNVAENIDDVTMNSEEWRKNSEMSVDETAANDPSTLRRPCVEELPGSLATRTQVFSDSVPGVQRTFCPENIVEQCNSKVSRDLMEDSVAGGSLADGEHSCQEQNSSSCFIEGGSSAATNSFGETTANARELSKAQSECHDPGTSLELSVACASYRTHTANDSNANALCERAEVTGQVSSEAHVSPMPEHDFASAKVLNLQKRFGSDSESSGSTGYSTFHAEREGPLAEVEGKSAAEQSPWKPTRTYREIQHAGKEFGTERIVSLEEGKEVPPPVAETNLSNDDVHVEDVAQLCRTDEGFEPEKAIAPCESSISPSIDNVPTRSPRGSARESTCAEEQRDGKSTSDILSKENGSVPRCPGAVGIDQDTTVENGFLTSPPSLGDVTPSKRLMAAPVETASDACCPNATFLVESGTENTDTFDKTSERDACMHSDMAENWSLIDKESTSQAANATGRVPESLVSNGAEVTGAASNANGERDCHENGLFENRNISSENMLQRYIGPCGNQNNVIVHDIPETAKTCSSCTSGTESAFVKKLTSRGQGMIRHVELRDQEAGSVPSSAENRLVSMPSVTDAARSSANSRSSSASSGNKQRHRSDITIPANASDPVFVPTGFVRNWHILNVRPGSAFHSGLFVDLPHESYFEDCLRVIYTRSGELRAVAFAKRRCLRQENLRQWWLHHQQLFPQNHLNRSSMPQEYLLCPLPTD